MNDALPKIRRAYELGRLRAALPWAFGPALLASVACAGCVERSVLFAMAGALSAVLVACAWRGGVLGAAAKVGFLAGLAAWLAPVTCPSPSICLAAGVVTGLAVGVVARTRASRRLEFVLVASAVAALAGALGCFLVGVGSIAAMGLALAASAVPVAFVPARRRA